MEKKLFELQKMLSIEELEERCEMTTAILPTGLPQEDLCKCWDPGGEYYDDEPLK